MFSMPSAKEYEELSRQEHDDYVTDAVEELYNTLKKTIKSYFDNPDAFVNKKIILLTDLWEYSCSEEINDIFIKLAKHDFEELGYIVDYKIGKYPTKEYEIHKRITFILSIPHYDTSDSLIYPEYYQ